MHSVNQNKPKGPLNFTTLEYNQNYLSSNDDLQLKLETSCVETKYKFEFGGLLVYDSKAQMQRGSDPYRLHPSPPEPPPKKPLTLKETIKSGHSDYSAFLRMKHHTPDPQYTPEYQLHVPNDNIVLVFDSKFESGNLHKAIKLTDYEYMLYLNSDTNTCDQNHWFYFSVINPRRTSIMFKLTNMIKKDLLYQSGMKPCVYSKALHERNGIKWHRDGHNISYTENQNDIKSLRFVGSKKYYTLSFTYDFRYENDTVYFAYALPYTHTQLSLYLADLQNRHPGILRVNTLCKTLGGNQCEVITITQSIKDYITHEEELQEWAVSSNSRKLAKLRTLKRRIQDKKYETYNPSKHENKKGIVLTARVHSGETVSSYMMLGAIDFLVGNSRAAKRLRKGFVFKIVPMLNPDGCKYGNNRCSLLGVDLNRRWEAPSKALHPTIYFTKKMIETFSERHEISMVCDMHGHSKRRNVFMYGCGVRSYDPQLIRRNLLARVVPYLMSLRNKLFSFPFSHFRMESDRKATARVVLWEGFSISHSYTMEASFYGPDKPSAFGKPERSDLHMTEYDLGTLGSDLCKLCLIFINPQSYMRKIRMTNDYLRQCMKFRGLLLSKNIIAGRSRTKNPKINALAEENVQKSYLATDPEVEALEKQKKEMNKANRKEEVKEVFELEQICEVEEEGISEEDMWEGVDVVNVEPDSDSGGSDSDCSIELTADPIRTTSTEPLSKPQEIHKPPLPKQKLGSEFSVVQTPQPIPSKSIIKKKYMEIQSDRSSALKHPSSFPTPRSVSPKPGIDGLHSETPIIPQVFLFPEEKINTEKNIEFFTPCQIKKEPVHFKEPASFYRPRPKKIYKIKSKINSISSYEKSSEVLGSKKAIDNCREYSAKNEKIFSMIRTHKMLNDFFNFQPGRNYAQSIANASRYKIEKMYMNK